MIIGKYAVVPAAVLWAEHYHDSELEKVVFTIGYGDSMEEARELVQYVPTLKAAESMLKQAEECIRIGEEQRAEARNTEE